jgi:hypothetical protein
MVIGRLAPDTLVSAAAAEFAVIAARFDLDFPGRRTTVSVIRASPLDAALSMASPVPAWAKYLAMFGAVSMMATFLWPLLWMSRILFAAHRLSRDLTHKRPPREADEQALGIDLAVLRQPRDQNGFDCRVVRRADLQVRRHGAAKATPDKSTDQAMRPGETCRYDRRK